MDAIPAQLIPSLLARFDQCVEYDTNGGCWLCRGVPPNRYGGMKVRGIGQVRLNRLSWMVYRGPIPDGLWVLHRCDVRPCFNPEHLFLGTPLMNNQDRHAKGRSGDHRGVLNGRAILGPKAVAEILAAKPYYGYRRDLAAKFGITVAAVKGILYGKNWRHLRTPCAV